MKPMHKASEGSNKKEDIERVEIINKSESAGTDETNDVAYLEMDVRLIESKSNSNIYNEKDIYMEFPVLLDENKLTNPNDVDNVNSMNINKLKSPNKNDAIVTIEKSIDIGNNIANDNREEANQPISIEINCIDRDGIISKPIKTDVVGNGHLEDIEISGNLRAIESKNRLNLNEDKWQNVENAASNDSLNDSDVIIVLDEDDNNHPQLMSCEPVNIIQDKNAANNPHPSTPISVTDGNRNDLLDAAGDGTNERDGLSSALHYDDGSGTGVRSASVYATAGTSGTGVVTVDVGSNVGRTDESAAAGGVKAGLNSDDDDDVVVDDGAAAAGAGETAAEQHSKVDDGLTGSDKNRLNDSQDENPTHLTNEINFNGFDFTEYTNKLAEFTKKMCEDMVKISPAGNSFRRLLNLELRRSKFKYEQRIAALKYNHALQLAETRLTFEIEKEKLKHEHIKACCSNCRKAVKSLYQD